MTQRLLTRILAVLVLTSSLYSAVFNGAWYCEGRRCGVTSWNCCCDAQADYQDAKCRKTVAKAQSDSSSMCAAGCRCVQVLNSVPVADRGGDAHKVAPAPAVVALLPTPLPAYVPPALVHIAVYRAETRGPPVKLSSVALPGLRAPPAA